MLQQVGLAKCLPSALATCGSSQLLGRNGFCTLTCSRNLDSCDAYKVNKPTLIFICCCQEVDMTLPLPSGLDTYLHSCYGEQQQNCSKMLTSVSQANDSWLVFAGISLRSISASCRVQNLHVVASHASAPKISNTFCGCASEMFFYFSVFLISWLFFERTFMVYYTNGNAPRAQPGRSSTSAIISKLIELCDIMLAAIERKWPTSDARLPASRTTHPRAIHNFVVAHSMSISFCTQGTDTQLSIDVCEWGWVWLWL